MKIYPAIDLRGGRVVRLQKGDYDREQRYELDPLALARSYAEAGAEWLHVVDLDGARSGDSANLAAIETIANQVPIRVQAGGGVRSEADFIRFVDAGVSRVVVGSFAVRDPQAARALRVRYGADSLTLALDARVDEHQVFRIATAGWRTLESVALDQMLQDFADDGFAHFLVTDIDRDGMLAGPNVALYRHLRALAPQAAILASGGVQGLDDLAELRQVGVAGVVIGKALLDGRFSLTEALA
ncbi:MAG: 1-(5-phosphoribosyl)-5-[(5-phosphoribosylamino)methylideneamino]imidazole-4-carboxamide isomerase [Rhodanobacteraceae bacterium]|nr:1-(5-phosphoribosyl)-5-[(5-phosphoribosylamino)methylideneamino]imidazole-4-carboxamide isomerase [Rhodanobacteraceae bacterium]